MQRLIDDGLGILKESTKTLFQESVSNTLRFINAFAAAILAVLPVKSSLEGVQGWELHPTLRGPRLPSWMEHGVSSFNTFIQEYESDSEPENESEHGSGLDDDNHPPSPSQSVSPSPSPSPSISRSPSLPQSQIQASGSKKRRGPLWKRALRKVFSPLRTITSEIKGASPSKRSSKGSTSDDSSTTSLKDESAFVRTSSSERFRRIYNMAKYHLSGVKDYMMPKQSGDRRRGIVEDLQFWMELAIERAFEVLGNIIYYTFSPLETTKLIFMWYFLRDSKQASHDYIGISTLGDSDATLHETVKRGQALNTDGRTCEDVITSLGYPYEAVQLTTPDGHILLLERIPRPDSQKVLYLQHGLLDSSLGWVSNGVVGSQAFAAYDQGYDVFLGNFRGLASREHVNRHISARRYWQYSVNEHGTQDIPTMLSKIHEIKMNDLKDIKDDVSTSNLQNCDEEPLPYALCGVAHSLGGASILIYVVTRRLEKKPHYLSRLILLSPAGFHEDVPAPCKVLQYVVPIVAPFVGPIVPGIYIPTRFCRALFNKLARDFQNYPAVGGLVQALLSIIVGGDSSDWIGAIGMSHYNMDDMPGVSFLVAMHLLQMVRTKRFIMFDFGSPEANIEAYGTPEPFDIGDHYGVIDIPVDFVAGVKDSIIPRSMVKRHYETLKNAGCTASYDEFEYAHLDFTFSHKEELLTYVMSRLLLVTPPPLNSGVRELPPPPPPTNVKAKSSSRKWNQLLLRKSPKLLKTEDGTEQDEHQNASQNEAEQVLEEEIPLAKTLSHGQKILSAVTAGSVATDSHEESFRESGRSDNSRPWDSPATQGYFIRTPLQEVKKVKHSKSEIRDNLTPSTPEYTNVHDVVAPTAAIKETSKMNVFSRLVNHWFKKPRSSSSRQLSYSQMSNSGSLWTLANCYSGGQINLDESSDE